MKYMDCHIKNSRPAYRKKDLGFTHDVTEDEHMYKGYHVKYNNRFIWIDYVRSEWSTVPDHVDIRAGHD